MHTYLACVKAQQQPLLARIAFRSGTMTNMLVLRTRLLTGAATSTGTSICTDLVISVMSGKKTLTNIRFVSLASACAQSSCSTGTGVGTDLVISVVSGNKTLTTSGQTRVAAFNGSAVFTGLTVRAPTEVCVRLLRADACSLLQP